MLRRYAAPPEPRGDQAQWSTIGFLILAHYSVPVDICRFSRATSRTRTQARHIAREDLDGHSAAASIASCARRCPDEPIESMIGISRAASRNVKRWQEATCVAEGLRNVEITERLDCRREVGSQWRKPFFEQRLLKAGAAVRLAIRCSSCEVLPSVQKDGDSPAVTDHRSRLPRRVRPHLRAFGQRASHLRHYGYSQAA